MGVRAGARLSLAMNRRRNIYLLRTTILDRFELLLKFEPIPTSRNTDEHRFFFSFLLFSFFFCRRGASPESCCRARIYSSAGALQVVLCYAIRNICYGFADGENDITLFLLAVRVALVFRQRCNPERRFLTMSGSISRRPYRCPPYHNAKIRSGVFVMTDTFFSSLTSSQSKFTRSSCDQDRSVRSGMVFLF